MFTDSDFDGTSTNAEHRGCSVGDDGVKAAKSTCADNAVAAGTYTSYIKGLVAADETATLTVNYVVNAGATLDVTSASVVVGTFSGTDTPTALLSSVSSSQTSVIIKNVNTRLTAVLSGGATGVGRSNASGVGREEPTAPSRFTSQPSDFIFGGSREGLLSINKTTNTFSEGSSRGVKLENALSEIAMLASFDTSQMILAAANENQGQPGATRTLGNPLVDRPWTIWGHGSRTSVTNTRNNSGDDSRYDGDVWGYNIGVDYRITSDLYAGASLGYSKTKLNTTYNFGTYREVNKMVTPYAVWQPDENIQLSAMAGYSIGDLEKERDDDITSDTDTSMWFASMKGAYMFQPKPDVPLSMNVHVGVLASRKKIDGYTESDGEVAQNATTNTRQVSTGLESAYTFDVQSLLLEPFVRTDYVHDFMDVTNMDHGAYNVGGGLRLGSEQYGLNGSIEGETQLGRSDYEEYSIASMVTYSFALDGEANAKSNMAEPYIKTTFTMATQTFGTGVKYTHGRLPLTINMDMSQSMPTTGGANAFQTEVKAALTF
ncbi:autotransporter outer membrane beta-barrel domain-containing protein [Magnetovibrio sp. PR-2]|uniref:autotransporter outer membrane beta-barrel domain-containing protein n=1 Tax=Magnetovibrio sp. PR-2 TaxID=3120356 RepID=UPI002FCDE597